MGIERKPALGRVAVFLAASASVTFLLAGYVWVARPLTGEADVLAVTVLAIMGVLELVLAAAFFQRSGW